MVVSKQIEQKVQSMPKGALLFIEDFTGDYGYEAARKTLQRLHNSEKIIRLAHGIYYVPKFDELLGMIKPSAEQIAKAVAKRDRARIIPTGSYALHKLGLSTQVPMNAVYLTDGSPRKVQIANQKITFKKTSPKNLAVNHRLTTLIIQGLKELGEANIESVQLEKLAEIIDKSGESVEVRNNIKHAPVWIQKLVMKILRESGNEKLAHIK
jgi:hypothetical protein